MTAAWLLFAMAVALVPLGSRGSLRLAVLTGTAASATVRAPLSIDWAAMPRLAGLIAGGLAGLGGGPALGAAVGLAVTTGGALMRMRERRVVVMRSASAALRVVRAVLAEVEAGAAPADALVAAADAEDAHDAELRQMADRVRASRDPTEAASADLLPLAHALRVSGFSGAAAGPVLDRVAAQLQDGLDQRRAVGAALAGARSSAALLALLPFVGLALGAGLGANPVAVLAGSRAGHSLVLCGVALECAGLVWTARLAAAAEGSP